MSKQSLTLLFIVADPFQTSIITNRIKKIKATKSKIYIEKCTMKWEMLAKRQLKRIITKSNLHQQWKALIWDKEEVELDLNLEIIYKSQ